MIKTVPAFAVGEALFPSLAGAQVAALCELLPDGIGSRQEAAHAIMAAREGIIAILTAKPEVAPAPKRKYTRKVKPVAAAITEATEAPRQSRFPRGEKHVEAGGPNG